LLPPRNPIGFHLIELQQVESTNNYATGLAHAGMAQHGTTVWAHHQTAGKGQRHKGWEAAGGENITASFIVEPQLLLSNAFVLSKAVAVAVSHFFSKYAGSETKVKWPNDLYWRDRKAGGILIENILSGTQWRYAIIGIGININQTAFGDAAQRAVSLRQVTGTTYSIPEMIKELAAAMEEAFGVLQTAPQKLEQAYLDRLYKCGETVRLKKGGRVFEAVIKGVTATGELIAHHGIEETFEVGAVEWVFNPLS
jgi:BirA family biotin operon repressor/biotin-[acetyl-CoA-carboxylase] ligase